MTMVAVVEVACFTTCCSRLMRQFNQFTYLGVFASYELSSLLRVDNVHWRFNAAFDVRHHRMP